MHFAAPDFFSARVLRWAVRWLIRSKASIEKLQRAQAGSGGSGNKNLFVFDANREAAVLLFGRRQIERRERGRLRWSGLVSDGRCESRADL